MIDGPPEEEGTNESKRRQADQSHFLSKLDLIKREMAQNPKDI